MEKNWGDTPSATLKTELFYTICIFVPMQPNALDQDRQGRGKRSIAIDMKKTEGISIVKKLCSDADVLIEPFRAGTNNLSRLKKKDDRYIIIN